MPTPAPDRLTRPAEWPPEQGATHARIHGVEVGDGLPIVQEYLRQCIAESELIPDGLRRPALERLAGLPRGNTLCHWDFHPANVLQGEAGPVVIAWTFALRGDAAADVARTRLTLRVGETPSGLSVVDRRVGRVRAATDEQHLSQRMSQASSDRFTAR